ncbi:hypothetical protein D3C73_1472600 [compost metagenome]
MIRGTVQGDDRDAQVIRRLHYRRDRGRIGRIDQQDVDAFLHQIVHIVALFSRIILRVDNDRFNAELIRFVYYAVF